MKKLLLILFGLVFCVSLKAANDFETYPFILSGAPQNGEWASNTQWYYITLRGKYMVANTSEEKVKLTTTKPVNDELGHWAIVGHYGQAIRIYNKALGTALVLASDAPNPNQDSGGRTFPYLRQISSLTTNLVGEWDFSWTKGEDCFYLDRYGNESYRLNDRGDVVSFWTGGSDGGSQFRTEAIFSRDAFQVSDKPDGDKNQWGNKTHWYQLSIRDKVIKYVAGQDKLAYCNAGENTDNDACYWCFAPSGNGGYKVYNKAAGPSMVMTATSKKNPLAGQDGTNIYPHMKTETSTTGLPSGFNGAWSIERLSNDVFLMHLEGEWMKLHDYGTNGLVFWKGYNNKYDWGSHFKVKAVHPLPFKLSDAPTVDGFAANTNWYELTISDQALYYDAKVDHIVKEALNSQNPKNYGSYWAFVKKDGTSNEYEIYNAGAGHTKVLSSKTVTNDETTHPYMAEKSATDGSVQLWDFAQKDAADAAFFLKLKGSANSYLNIRNDKLAFWNNNQAFGDPGSSLKVQEPKMADIQGQIDWAKSDYQLVNGVTEAANSLRNEADYTTIQQELAKNTVLGYATAFRMIATAERTPAFNENKYYRLRTVGSGRYMTMGDWVYTAGMNKQDISQVWSITSANNNMYHIGAQSRKLKDVTKSARVGITDETQAGAHPYSLTSVRHNRMVFDAEGGVDHDRLNESPSQEIVGWLTDDANSQWYLFPANDIEVVISEAGFATVNYPFAVELPQSTSGANIQAFVGAINKSNQAHVFVLRELRNRRIPANTPVILAGDANTYSLKILDKNVEVEPVANNPLKGSFISREIPTSETAYVLAQPTQAAIGFYKLNSNQANRKIGANKAYLPGSSIPAAAATSFGFAFSWEGQNDGTTGIEETTTNVADEEYYDLKGRRVLHPSKGIFVTKSGKKVLFMN